MLFNPPTTKTITLQPTQLFNSIPQNNTHTKNRLITLTRQHPPNPSHNPPHHTFNTHINNMDTQNPLRSPQKIPASKKIHQPTQTLLECGINRRKP